MGWNASTCSLIHSLPAGSQGDAAHEILRRSRRVYCNRAGNKIATLGPWARVVPFLPRAPHARTASAATMHTRFGIFFSIVDRSKHLIRFAGVGELIYLRSTFRTRSHDAECWISGTAATKALPPSLPHFFSSRHAFGPLVVQALHRNSGVSTVSRPPFDSEPAPRESYERPYSRSVTASQFRLVLG